MENSPEDTRDGFIKLFRKFTRWGWYHDVSTKSVFLHLLLTANYKPSEYAGMEVPRGAVVTGRRALSTALCLSEDRIRTSLHRLKSTNEITIKTTNRFSIITVVRYNDYQQIPSKIPNGSPTDPQRIPTSKEVKKERIKNKNTYVLSDLEKNIISAWNAMAKENVLPVVKKLNDKRRENLCKAVKVVPELDDWIKIITTVPSDKFRLGEGDRGWKANIDWLLRPISGNYIKLLEEE